MASQQKVEIRIPNEYTPAQREEIAQDVVDFIVNRTRDKNLDKDNNKMPGYSKEYKSSDEFRIAGKSAGDIDLTLTGDMLDSLEVLSHRVGSITIGYAAGSQENGKVEGNRLGTYGKSTPDASKARDFLGIHNNDLNSILRKFPAQAAQSELKSKVLSDIIKRIGLLGSLGFK